MFYVLPGWETRYTECTCEGRCNDCTDVTPIKKNGALVHEKKDSTQRNKGNIADKGKKRR